MTSEPLALAPLCEGRERGVVSVKTEGVVIIVGLRGRTPLLLAREGVVIIRWGVEFLKRACIYY